MKKKMQRSPRSTAKHSEFRIHSKNPKSHQIFNSTTPATLLTSRNTMAARSQKHEDRCLLKPSSKGKKNKINASPKLIMTAPAAKSPSMSLRRRSGQKEEGTDFKKKCTSIQKKCNIYQQTKIRHLRDDVEFDEVVRMHLVTGAACYMSFHDLVEKVHGQDSPLN